MARKNLEERKEYNREYRTKNKEQLLLKRKEWEEKNKNYLREYHKEYHRKWYEENKVKRREQLREYEKTHRDGAKKRALKFAHENKEKVRNYGNTYNLTPNGRFRLYRFSAERRGKSFDLTREQFIKLLTGLCAYCGASGKNGIDRIDNTIGYTTGNCTPCCKTCNYMKKDMSVQEFMTHIKKISNFNT